MQTIEEKILFVLAEKVDPFIKSHSGKIVFISFENGVVNIKLEGACVGCPFSFYTVHDGVERILREIIPEVLSVNLIC